MFIAPALKAFAMSPHAQTHASVVEELAKVERAMRGEFMVFELSAADFAVFPLVAMAVRLGAKTSGWAMERALGDKTRAWVGRMESLPYFEKADGLFAKETTTDITKPHWGKKSNDYFIAQCKQEDKE